MRQPTKFVLPAVAAAAALVLAGCSPAIEEEAEPTDTVYCVDAENTIVDEELCNEQTETHHSGASTALLFFMIGRYAGGLSTGTRLDPTLSSQRFQTTDTEARRAANLATSGVVRNGTSAATGKPASLGKSGTSGKSGGFGTGG